MLRLLLCSLLFANCISSIQAEEQPVAANAKLVIPLTIGEMLPDVSVKDTMGQNVKLNTLHSEGPLVIVFFRGSWCPFCTRHFQELIKASPEVTELGAKMIAISPDSVENTKANSEKLKIPFPVLSDSDLTATKAFGLAFTVDDSTITRYKGFGIDLEKASGHDHHALPVPAVYIVDQSGKIVFAHSDSDYKKRLDVDAILSELKTLQ